LADYRMVSVVQWPFSPVAVDELGDGMAENYTWYFRIGTFDPTTGEYVEYDQGLIIEPGKAYWMVSRDGFNPTVYGVPVTTSIPVYVELDYNSGTQVGWNMIGCPNKINYFWDSLEVVEYDSDGVIVGPVDDEDNIIGPISISDLQAQLGVFNDYIDTLLWRWTGETYLSDTAIMEAYEGYWVKVKKPNIYLGFVIEAQTVETNTSIPPASVRAVSGSVDLPPWPIGFDEEGYEQQGSGGCFVDVVFTELRNSGAGLILITLISAFAFIGGLVSIVYFRSRH